MKPVSNWNCCGYTWVLWFGTGLGECILLMTLGAVYPRYEVWLVGNGLSTPEI